MAEVVNKSNTDVKLELNIPFYREEIIGNWRISNMEKPYYREKDEVELIVPTKSEVGIGRSCWPLPPSPMEKKVMLST